MKLFADFLYIIRGIGEQHFCVIQSCISDKNAQITPIFFLEFPGQVVRGIAKVAGDCGKIQILGQMDGNIADTVPDEGGGVFVHLDLMYPVNVIIQHNLIDIAQLRHGGAVFYILDIFVAERIRKFRV